MLTLALSAKCAKSNSFLPVAGNLDVLHYPADIQLRGLLHFGDHFGSAALVFLQISTKPFCLSREAAEGFQTQERKEELHYQQN